MADNIMNTDKPAHIAEKIANINKAIYDLSNTIEGLYKDVDIKQFNDRVKTLMFAVKMTKDAVNELPQPKEDGNIKLFSGQLPESIGEALVATGAIAKTPLYKNGENELCGKFVFDADADIGWGLVTTNSIVHICQTTISREEFFSYGGRNCFVPTSVAKGDTIFVSV